MSTNAISVAAAAALPTVKFHSHGHHRGGASAASDSVLGSNAVGSIGQLPVGATSGQFGNLLTSLEQTVNAQSATSAGVATSSAATGAVSSQSGTAAAKNFLSNLLQTLQSGSTLTPNVVGTSANTKV